MGLLSRFADHFGSGGLLGYGQPQPIQLGYDAPQAPPVDTPFGQMSAPAPNIQDQMQRVAQIQQMRPPMAGRIGALLKDAGASLQGRQGGAQDALAQDAETQRLMLALQDEATKAGLSPQELLAMKLNPKAFGEDYSSRFGDVVLNKGAVRNRAGQNIAGAPSEHVMGDRIGSYDPTTGVTTYSDPRDPSFQESTQRQVADQNAVNQQNMAEYRAIQAQIAQERANTQAGHYRNQDSVARQREGRLGSGGPAPGHGGGPQRGSGSATMDAIAAELKRRGKL